MLQWEIIAGFFFSLRYSYVEIKISLINLSNNIPAEIV